MLGVDGYLSGNTEGGVLLARTRGAELRFLLWHILEPSLSKGKVSDSCVCLQLALSFGKHCHSELWEGCHLCSELLVTACVIQLLLIWCRIDRKWPRFEAEGNKG